MNNFNIYYIVEAVIVFIIILATVPMSKYQSFREIPRKRLIVMAITLLPLIAVFAVLAPYAVRS